MSDEPGEGESRLGSAASIRLPLNSKRLTTNHLRRLASELEVPTTASPDEIRQMIDGKLTEAGREVLNVQVVLVSAQPTCEFSLEDEGGKFLTVPAAEPGAPEDPTPSEPREGEGGEEELREEIEALKRENQTLHDHMSTLENKLEEEKVRFRDLWRTNCRCLAEYDALISAKDTEIKELKHQLLARSGSASPSAPDEALHLPSGGGTPRREEPTHPVAPRTRRGKAPPVDPFTGEDVEVRLDDWLPSLERAKLWNDWTEDELMLQLAGHLRGRARQEWSLLGVDVKKSYVEAMKALRLCLDPGSHRLAAH